MAAKKSMNLQAGGVLVFLGSLVYLYVAWQAYAGGAASTWLGGYAQIWTPFVAAVAIFAAISLFFMSIGNMAGKGGDSKDMANWTWKIVMWAAITFLIWTAGSAWFLWVIIALVLTYLGTAWESMM